MKDIVPAPAPIVRNQFEKIRELFTRHVVPSYTRFDLALARATRKRALVRDYAT